MAEPTTEGGAPPAAWQGVVVDVDGRRPPARLPWLALAALLAAAGAAAWLAGSDGSVPFLRMPEGEPPASARQIVEEALQRATLLRARGEVDEAEALLRSLHERYPEEPSVNRELGRLHLDRGNLNFAAEYFELAAERTPRNSKLSFYRGELAMKEGEASAALASPSPSSLASSSLLDRLDEARQAYERAIVHFQRSLEGPAIHDQAGADERLRRSRLAVARCRLRRAEEYVAQGQGLLGVEASAAAAAVAELDALLQTAGLSDEVRVAAQALRSRLDGGR